MMRLLSIALVAVILIGAGGAGGWFAKGYRVETQARRQMEKAIDDAKQQSIVDSKLLGIQVAKQIKIEKDFADVEDVALCDNGGADFLRVFNDAVNKAN